MNELYNETVVRNGKTYHYDPDMDCYYCRYTDESTVSKTAWIYTVIVLAIACYAIEHWQL
jgi:hypothetical protein